MKNKQKWKKAFSDIKQKKTLHKIKEIFSQFFTIQQQPKQQKQRKK